MQALVHRDGDPVVRVLQDDAGRPKGAIAEMRLAASPARVWEIVRDVEAYPGRVPMVHKVRLEGDRLWMQVRFRIALFSTKFAFTAKATWENERWLELDYVSGEPADINLRFEVTPEDDGAATKIVVRVTYDPRSLGWLVKVFLRHHPEIELGLFPGTALVLLDALRRAAAST